MSETAVIAEAPPVLDTPDFPGWLQRQLNEAGLSQRAAGTAIGIRPQGLSRYMRQRVWPLPDRLDRIAEHFHAPQDWIAAWHRQAVAHWGHLAPRILARAGLYEGQTIRFNCATCGQEFEDSALVNRVYCSRRCSAQHRTAFRSDTTLKARVLGKMRARNLNATDLARLTGIGRSTIAQWLLRPHARLRLPSLARVAQWLDISVEEAAKLQDGTAEDQTRERLHRLRDSDAYKRFQKRLRTTPLGRKFGERATAATRGKAVSPEHREKLSAALRRYRQRPDAHPFQGATLRSRARRLLNQLQRKRPDHDDAAHTEAVERLLQAPYNVPTKQAARALLQPRRKKHPRGRPFNDRRCEILTSFDATWPRTAASRRAGGFVRGAFERVQRIEGARAPSTEASFRRWWTVHQAQCLKHQGEEVSTPAKH